MKWSLRLGQVAGIGIYVHWTFFLLIGWVFFVYTRGQNNWVDGIEGVAFIVTIFGCIVLHELGHALTARHYQIATKDITLLPIGGLARLERMPEDPKQELWVALAGPAVNVAIALGLFVVLFFWEGIAPMEYADPAKILQGGSLRKFLFALMAINIVLVIFNLLPAFPMDGGRVLRALLALKLDYVQATNIAATIGQAMAFLFGIWGFFNSQFLLMFVALFVYLGAEQEAASVQFRQMFRKINVRKAMQSRFRAVSPEATLGQAVAELLAGAQQDFPVVDQGKVVGMLDRSDLLRSLAERGQDTPVRDIMRTEIFAVTSTDSLENSFQTMQANNRGTVPVIDNGELVGILTAENISEWVMVRNALHHHPPGRTPG